MARIRIPGTGGIDVDVFDFDPVDTTLAEASQTAVRLRNADGEEFALQGSFSYVGAARLPSAGTITGFALIDEGEVELIVPGLSLPVAGFLSALMAGGDEADERDADDLLDLFDVDPLDTGDLVSASPTAFAVDFDGTIASFTGAFLYGGGTDGLPTSGIVTAYELAEEGEVEIAWADREVSLADLYAAFAADEGDDPADDGDEDDDLDGDSDETREDRDDEEEEEEEEEQNDEDDEEEEDDGTSDDEEDAAEALLDLFDIDPLETGELLSAGTGGFAVAWGGAVATFTGAFVYGNGESALPTAGIVTEFTFTEGDGVEIDETGLEVFIEDLYAAFEIDAGDDDAGGGNPLFAELFAGDDRFRGSRDDDLFRGAAGNDRLLGRSGEDQLFGGEGRDRLNGGAGRDHLDGGEGNDRLVGGNGDDVLAGGHGRDILSGGGGADVFDFAAAAESGSRRQMDRIRDFDRGDDLVDLSDIDADGTTDGDEAFTLLSGRRFGGEAGELVCRGNVVMGDTDGDGRPDLMIHLRGARHLEADDFVL